MLDVRNGVCRLERASRLHRVAPWLERRRHSLTFRITTTYTER